MTTILVAVCCERCNKIVPPGLATKTSTGWVCREHYSQTPEWYWRQRRRKKGAA